MHSYPIHDKVTTENLVSEKSRQLTFHVPNASIQVWIFNNVSTQSEYSKILFTIVLESFPVGKVEFFHFDSIRECETLAPYQKQ